MKKLVLCASLLIGAITVMSAQNADSAFTAITARINTCYLADTAVAGQHNVMMSDKGPQGFMIWNPDSVYVSWVAVVTHVVNADLSVTYNLWGTYVLYRDGNARIQFYVDGEPVVVTDGRKLDHTQVLKFGNQTDAEIVATTLWQAINATPCKGD